MGGWGAGRFSRRRAARVPGEEGARAATPAQSASGCTPPRPPPPRPPAAAMATAKPAKKSAWGDQEEIDAALANKSFTKFHFMAVLVAGVGFFADAYDLFIIGARRRNGRRAKYARPGRDRRQRIAGPPSTERVARAVGAHRARAGGSGGAPRRVPHHACGLPRPFDLSACRTPRPRAAHCGPSLATAHCLCCLPCIEAESGRGGRAGGAPRGAARSPSEPLAGGNRPRPAQPPPL